MIFCVIRDNAGPGNQMFMYAFAYSLAVKYHSRIFILSEIGRNSVRQNVLKDLALDPSIVRGMLRLDRIRSLFLYRLLRKLIFRKILHLRCFLRVSQRAEDSRKYQPFGRAAEEEQMPGDHMKKKCAAVKTALTGHRPLVTDGYWECHAYFDDCREKLKDQFRPAYMPEEEVRRTLEEIRNCESVAVHIRKGDFREFGRLIRDSYYSSGINRMRAQLDSPVFYILSEDEGVREKYRNIPDCRILDFHTKHKYLDEWYALVQCRHHIIANSTYSWWAAWLSESEGKRVLIPDLNVYLAAEPGNDEEMYRNYYGFSGCSQIPDATEGGV